jgi:hypothetical protein
MPDFDLQAPDGKRYRLSVPEGATQEQILAKANAAKAQLAVPTPPPQGPVSHAIGEAGRGIIEGGKGTVEALTNIPGAVKQAVTAPVETTKAVGRAFMQDPAKFLGGETGAYLARAVGGDPSEGVTPPDVRTVAREATQFGLSQRLGGAIPTAVKAATKGIVKGLPGSAVERHALAIPEARAAGEALRPPTGAVSQAYADLAAVGNPTLYMGSFRTKVQDLLSREMRKANKDTGFVGELQNYLDDSAQGWDFGKVRLEADELHERLRTKATSPIKVGNAPSTAARRYDQEYRDLVAALHQDVDAGAPFIAATGTAGAPTPQTVAASEQWQRARDTARREFSGRSVLREIEDNISQVGDAHESLNLNPVIRGVVRQMNKAKYGDKAALLFTGAFQPGELDRFVGQLRTIQRNLPRIPPGKGVITGSSQRVLRGTIGAGAGALAGELMGGRSGAAVGAMAGVEVPELIQQAMMTDTGRALVRTAMKIDPKTGPVTRNILGALLRTQMPSATKGKATDEFYRANAEHSLGGHDAATEDVAELAAVHRDVDRGGTPDVQQQLRSGRLSMPAIKATLTKVTPQNASSVLEYMGLDDAEHMLSVANEQERQWLQPMVQKKAQQTMQNPKAPSWLRAQATQLNDRIGRTLFPDELLEGTQ